jgi:hypothetical protein
MDMQDRRSGKDRRLLFLAGLDRRQFSNNGKEQLQSVTHNNFGAVEQKSSVPESWPLKRH